MVKPAVREARKALAEERVQKVCDQGKKLGGIGDIENILAEHAQSIGASNFFECLSDNDLRDIYTNARNSTTKRPRAHLNEKTPPSINTNTGPAPLPTPGQTPLPSEADEHSEGHRELDNGTEDVPGEAKEEKSPSIGEVDAAIVDICFYHPKQGRFQLLRGSYWKRRRSYISVRIIKRWKLSPDPCGEEATKSQSTRFRVAKDEDIIHDIVIGKAWNESDGDEYDYDNNEEAHEDESREEEEQSEEEEEEEEVAEDDTEEEEAGARIQGEEFDDGSSEGGEDCLEHDESEENCEGVEYDNEEENVSAQAKRIRSVSEPTRQKSPALCNPEKAPRRTSDQSRGFSKEACDTIGDIVTRIGKNIDSDNATHMKSNDLEEPDETYTASPKQLRRPKASSLQEATKKKKATQKDRNPRKEATSSKLNVQCEDSLPRSKIPSKQKATSKTNQPLDEEVELKPKTMPRKKKQPPSHPEPLSEEESLPELKSAPRQKTTKGKARAEEKPQSRPSRAQATAPQAKARNARLVPSA